MIDLDDPNVKKHVDQKRRLRDAHVKASSTSTSEACAVRGVAPGNRAVKKFIVLDLGRPIPLEHDPWTSGDAFEIEFEHQGAVVRRSLGELRSANGGKWTEFELRAWNCVTGWSFADGLKFNGVGLDVVLRCAFGENLKFECLFQTGADGYTTSVDARDLDGAFLAVTDESGEMVSREHGGPRLVFPTLFGWKSAKYLKSVTLRAYEGGFWEKLGCHRRGRWALDERWASGTSSRVWTALAWLTNRYQIFGDGIWIWVMVVGGKVLGAIASFTSLFSIGNRNRKLQ